MNKSELKSLWGNYTDTDKLVEDIRALLTHYGHANSEKGVCTMLDEYFTNKHHLIDIISKSDNYAGDMRIILNKEFERENSAQDIRNFCYKFPTDIDATKMITSKIDANGKKVSDYLKVGKKTFNADDLLAEDFVASLHPTEKHLNEFDRHGYTKKSVKKLNQFLQSVDKFGRITASALSEEHVNAISATAPDVKLAAGLKTSRAFNKLCNKYGVDKSSSYNKLFAEYADMVSGLKRNLDYVISLNPYDYLTMSFGKSWASCHTIDKSNRRNMPNHYSGAYCGGTLSYMLDSVSMIIYVIDRGANPQTADKLYRNMFHYGANVLIQGRIYPQGNDGATDLYKTFRKHLQDELAQLLHLENNSWTKSNKNPGQFVYDSVGVHYRDYTQFSSCNVTYPTEQKDVAGMLAIGHDSICPKCGAIHHSQGDLVCYNCRY